jgi:Mor family transcriptional regulator
MREEYEVFAKTMEDRFPKMFAGKYGGFAVGAGWYPILEVLCANIQSHIDWRVKQGKDIAQVEVNQIKEKFGGLRFYYSGGDDEISGMVRMAEAWADIACEECGAAGKRRSGGWIRTLCDKHEEEHQERKRNQEMKASGFEE